jgi:CII-binding regulator of phage lambda lysogenization HflD
LSRSADFNPAASDHHTHEKEQTTGAAGQITDSGHIKSLDTTISDVQAEGSVSEKDDTTLQNENIALRRKLRTKEDLLAALNTQLDMAREETQVYKNKYEELLADVTRMIERRK